MTRRSLRKLEQQEAQDERRRSLSPLPSRGRSAGAKSNTPSARRDGRSTANIASPHARLSNRSLSPSGGALAPFQVPSARANSPPLSPFTLSASQDKPAATESRTGDWVAVSSRFTDSGDLRVPGSGNAMNGTSAIDQHRTSAHTPGASGNHITGEAHSRGLSPSGVNTNTQSSDGDIHGARSRSPVLRNVTDDLRTRSQMPTLPPFSISSERGTGSAPGAAHPSGTSEPVHPSRSSRPLSAHLRVPPNTTAHTGDGEDRSYGNGNITSRVGCDSNPLEKLRQRLEAWKSAPIAAGGQDDDVPMSPPQFPPARTTSHGGSWSASEQLGRPPTGRGSAAGTGTDRCAFPRPSQSHRGPFNSLRGDEVAHSTRSVSGLFPEPAADASSPDFTLGRPRDRQSSEANEKILDGSGTPLSAWHATQSHVPCSDDGADDKAQEEPSNMWTMIPELLTKYGGPGRLVCSPFSLSFSCPCLRVATPVLPSNQSLVWQLSASMYKWGLQ